MQRETQTNLAEKKVIVERSWKIRKRADEETSSVKVPKRYQSFGQFSLG